MKNTSSRNSNIEYISARKHGAFGLAVSGVLLTATLAQAQVEALEANPLEPAGVGADRGIESRGRGSGGTRIGRSAGRAGRAEENPAETLLRDIDGTNCGRRTGHTLTRASKIPVGAAERRDSPSLVGQRPRGSLFLLAAATTRTRFTPPAPAPTAIRRRAAAPPSEQCGSGDIMLHAASNETSAVAGGSRNVAFRSAKGRSFAERKTTLPQATGCRGVQEAADRRQAVLFLLDNDFVTGVCLPMDGGRTIHAAGS